MRGRSQFTPPDGDVLIAVHLAPPSLPTAHPLGKSPVITDGDNTLAESGAIIEYLVEQNGAGRLVPPGAGTELAAF